MFRSAFILAFCCWALSGVSQGDNPFEVRATTVTVGTSSASDTVAVIDTAVAEAKEEFERSTNPFEINTNVAPVAVPTASQRQATGRRLLLSSNGPSKGLILIYTILALVVLSVSIALNRGRFKLILSSLINGNALKTLERGSKAWTDLQSILLYSLFFSNGAVMLWILNSRLFGIPQIGFLYCLGGLIILYLIRHLLMKGMSTVYVLDNSAEQFNYSIAIHNIAIGMILIPFILSLGYVADDNVRRVAIFMLVLIGLIYLLRQAKGFLSALGMRDLNPFYFFIYLCAFEITPILIAWRMTNGVL